MVNGFDVVTQAADVRESISLTGQFAAVDEILTGRENLVLIAKLRHLDQPGRIADDLLARFSLTDAGGRRVATYSGGMRRRLDIAMSLIGSPPVIFLDEPTTGLDPQARLEVWQSVRELAHGGTTVLLTTQYLDEAEQLADRIAILHEGRILVNGTLAELKALMPPAQVEYVEKQPSLEDIFLALVGRRTGTDKRPERHRGRSGRHGQLRSDDEQVLPPRHERAAGPLPASHPAQPGHDHHHRDHADRHVVDVRVRLRRSDRHGRRQVRQLPPTGHPADHGRVRRRLHGLAALHRRLQRNLRAVPVDADRPLGGPVGARADLADRQPDLARTWSSSSPWRSGSAREPGILAWLGVLGIIVLFTLALTWLAVIPGLAAKSPDGAGAFAYPLLFLPFVSSAFVPTTGMPGPVKWFAEHQPVTSIVNTLRNLYADQPLGNDLWTALAWCVGLLVVA